MNPTPSPERPEHNPGGLKPEHYGAPDWRLLRVGEDIAKGDEWINEAGKWERAGWVGCPVVDACDTYRRRVATRTPAPEAVAGEPCKKCHGKGWIYRRDNESEQCDCIFADPPEPTPPVEADSVHLADKLLTRSAKGFDYLVSFGGGRGPDVWDNERTVNGVDIHDALSQARGLVEDSDGWIFRIEQNDHPPTTRDKLESDLTTAHAEIARLREENQKLSEMLTFHGHRVEEARNFGFPGMPQGQCECRVCRKLYSALTDALNATKNK